MVGIITDITGRKRMEEELRERERFLESIFASIQDGIGIIDLDMNILRINPTAENWYPHAKPFPGKKCYEAFHGRSERCEMCPAWQTLKTGESACGIVAKSGSGGEDIGWLEIYSFPMIDKVTGQMKGVIEYVRDITGRKLAERALEVAITKAEDEKNKSEAIISALGDGIIIQDTDYKIIYQNKVQSNQHGDHTGEYCYKAYEGRNTICDGCPVELSFRDGNIHTGVKKVANDMGMQYFELTASPLRDSTGKIIAGIKVVRDITGQKRIEEELRRAHDELELRVRERTEELIKSNEALKKEIAERQRTEEKYRILIDNSQDGVFIIQDAKFQFVNEAFAKITGYTVEEMIGNEFQKFVAPEDLEMVLDRYYRRQAGENIPKEYEFRILHKSGARVLINMNMGLITYLDRVASMGTVKDITEKKNLEAQLIRAQRMESIGTLAGGIAHDINNILTPIMLSLQLLRSKHTDEGSQNLINILERSANRGANMMKQIVSFARGIEGERMELEVTQLISEIKKIAKETFPRSIEIRTDVPKDLWSVSGDATQLHQVLMNLCVNARDAMPDGGTLTISAENLSIDESYARTNIEAKTGFYIAITVSDTGTGIPPGIMDRIFEPFFTTKAPGKGTGLGLSTALAIVKSHGGFINVYSETGKGTAFRVHLPAITTTGGMQKVKEQQHELPSGNGEVIMVVDDEAQIREVTRAALESNGYRVITASNGEEAVALYSNHKEVIRAVLMDMMMPVMDGRASIRELRKIDPGIRIIAVSGLERKDKLTEAAIVNVDAFLPKPYTAGRLLRTLRDVLDVK